MPPLFNLTHPDDIRTPVGSTMSDQHRHIQEQLQVWGASKRLFRKNVERAVGVVYVNAPRIIPDAFAINHNDKRVTMFEVCISYTPDWTKLQKVAAWFEWLASHGWSARLLYVTERGMLGIDPTNGEADREQMDAMLRLLRCPNP